MAILQGKRILITGLLSDRSIAYGVAKSMYEQGAELAFSYQNERFQDRVKELASDFNSNITLACDVSDDQSIQQLFNHLAEYWPKFDGFVHSIAYAPADQLNGDYLEVINREGFRIAHEISSYSFAALAKAALPFLQENAALLTLTYLGAERVITNYNVMGLAKASLEANVRYLASSMGPKNVRVNGLSAGPLRTLAASGIKDFRRMLNFNEKITPLRRNISLEDVGNAAAFLCSNLASGITGEVVHVDNGFHIVGLGDLQDT